jgi:hypothetical protein
MTPSRVLFNGFCDVAKGVVTHPETNLANSGYMPDMKVGKKKKNPGSFLYSWLPTGTYCKNLAI